MSNDKKNEFAGELLPPEVIRKGIYELGKVDRVPPEVGIFDAPVRCFRVNQEWWAIIGGMVHLLADVVSWKDASDESYPPILAILKFMQGVECDVTDYRLRQKPTDDCILQQSIDAGETWTDVFDFSLCLNPKFTTVTGQLQIIERQNIVNSGYSPATTTTTGLDGAYTPEQMQDLGIEADVCDTAGKDAIYGAIDKLVRYIHAVNVDVLQEIAQGANVPEQASRFVSAVPGVGLLPFDELISYTAFIVNELLAEYNATADETLLQTVICDLFCIAVNSGCVLNLLDIYDYFSGKVSPNLSTVANTLANLVQFAITGTFSGDDYFYFMCYFQMSIAGAKQRFLDINSADTYKMQLAAGFNSPDNDWAIFCVDCPQQYRLWTHDFSSGMGDWIILSSSGVPGGTLVNGRVQGTLNGAATQKFVWVGWNNFNPTWRIEGIKIYHEQINATPSSQNTRSIRLRPIPNSSSGETVVATGASVSNGVHTLCADSVSYWSDAQQVFISLTVLHDADSQCYLDKVEILFSVDHAPAGAVITEDADLCS